MSNEPATLFDVVPDTRHGHLGEVRVLIAPEHARTRNADPDTSFQAAASVRNITETHNRVLELLRTYGPQTDEQLLDLWGLAVSNGGWPSISPSGLRSRRAELVDAGWVRDTGKRGKTATGRACAVWEATE